MAVTYMYLTGGFTSDPAQAGRDAYVANRLAILGNNYTDPSMPAGFTTIVTPWTAFKGAFQDAINNYPPAGSFNHIAGINFGMDEYVAQPASPQVTPGGDPFSYEGVVFAILSNASVPPPPLPPSGNPLGNPGTQSSIVMPPQFAMRQCALNWPKPLCERHIRLGF